MIEGTLPISALTAVAGLASTRAVLAVQGFGTNAGSVLSQGDAAHRGPQARALGASGAGVTVGVISDSINRVGGGIANSQASGDLPGPDRSPGPVLHDGPRQQRRGQGDGRDRLRRGAGNPGMLFTTGRGAATRASGIDNSWRPARR